MAKAYVLVNVDAGSDDDVFAALKDVGGIEEIHVVIGGADLIVELAAGEIESVREIVYEKIRKVPQVRSTQTMTVVK